MDIKLFYDNFRNNYDIGLKVEGAINRYEIECQNSLLECFNKLKETMQEYPEEVQGFILKFWLDRLAESSECQSILIKSLSKSYMKSISDNKRISEVV